MTCLDHHQAALAEGAGRVSAAHGDGDAAVARGLVQVQRHRETTILGDKKRRLARELAELAAVAQVIVRLVEAAVVHEAVAVAGDGI